MKKLHKAIQEYKHLKRMHDIQNVFLIYNHSKNDYSVWLYFSKKFIINNFSNYSVY